MKYKYPKKLIIGSSVFEMRYDKKSSSGEFAYPYKKKKGFIRIGTQCSKLRMLDIFIHEVKEIINYEQGVRLDDPTASNNYRFVYEHKEHADFCSRLAGILYQFVA